ncbi:SBBP repeat-containing protein [Elusimicrobiota bacterium]
MNNKKVKTIFFLSIFLLAAAVFCRVDVSASSFSDDPNYPVSYETISTIPKQPEQLDGKFGAPLVFNASSGDFSISSGVVFDGGLNDIGHALAVDTITAGGPYIFVAGEDAGQRLILKYDSSGNELTNTAFGTGLGSWISDIKTDNSGNVYVSGVDAFLSNFVTAKFNNNLDLITFDTVASVGFAEGVAIDSSGNNIYTVGKTAPTNDFLIVRFDSSLNEINRVSFDSTFDDYAYAVEVDSSGNVYVTGKSNNNFSTVKLSSDLSKFISSATFDRGSFDIADDIAIRDGKVYVAGYSHNGSHYDYLTLKYNSDLSVVLSSAVYYSAGKDQRAHGIALDDKGSVYVVGASSGGATSYDYLTVKYDVNLSSMSISTYTGTNADHAYGVDVDSSSNVYVTGQSHSGLNYDIRTIRYQMPGVSVPEKPESVGGVALSSSSIRWYWDLVPNATYYHVYSTMNVLLANIETPTTYFDMVNLSTNEDYGVYFKAGNESGLSWQSGEVYRWTKAEVPGPNNLISVSTDSIVVGWSTNGNPSWTNYSCEISTDDFASVSASSQTLNTSATFYSLISNATYWIKTRTINQDNAYSDYNSAVSTITELNTPTALAFSNVNGHSIQANWDANNNSEATIYISEISSVSVGGTVLQSSQTLNTFLLYSGLESGVTYHFQVKAIGHNGTYTNFVSLGSISTLLESPTGFYGVADSTESITWHWSTGTYVGTNVQGYKKYTSTGSYIATFADVSISSGIESGLQANTQYLRYLTAYNGVSESTPSATASVYTAANSPVNLSSSAVTRHSVTLTWTENGGTTFSIDKSTNGVDWSTGVATGVSASGYTLESLELDTTYYFAVWGYNGDGIIATSSATSSAIKTQNLPAGVSLIYSSTTTTKTAEDSLGTVTITIPAGALTDNYTTSYMLINTDAENSPQGFTKPQVDNATDLLNQRNTLLSGSGLEMHIYDLVGSTFTGTFTAGKPVRLVMEYPDADNDDIIDNTNPPIRTGTLKIFTLNPATLEWEVVEGEHVLDETAKTVTAQLVHLSMYALVSVNLAATTLENVKV